MGRHWTVPNKAPPKAVVYIWVMSPTEGHDGHPIRLPESKANDTCHRHIFTGCNKVVAKIIFLHLSIIHSVHREGVSVSVHTGIPHPPWSQIHPPGADTPLWDQVHPPDQVHPLETGTLPQPGTPGIRYTPRTKYTPWTKCPLGTKYTPLGLSTPPGTKYIPLGLSTPPGTKYTPTGTKYTPLPEADSGIRSMSGRYASYWNAFLLRFCTVQCRCNRTGTNTHS